MSPSKLFPGRAARSAAFRLAPLALLVLAGCESLWPPDTNPYTTIHPVSDFGHATQEIYAQVTAWTLAIWVVVFILLGYVLIRFRDDGSPGNPKQVHGNPQLEFAWTLFPIFVVIAITVPTIRTIFKLADAAPEGAVEIKVIGKRWWWRFDYLASGVVTANELHIPAGQPVSLLLESDTVLHSFWAPRIGGKRDLVPGRVNRIWFTTDEIPPPGQPIEYLGECAEYCGEQHARMRFRVYAHEPNDFQQWLKDMATPVTFADPNLQKRGEEVFASAGCAGCHVVVGNKLANGVQGPSLTRFGQRHSVGAGAALFDDISKPGPDDIAHEEKRKILYQWLKDPDSLKSGTTAKTNASRVIDGMNIPRELTDEELNILVDYLLAMK